MEDKLKIIDSIMEFHPSWGVDIGLSYYVGGMMDSGGWYLRKMLDLTADELSGVLLTLQKKRDEDSAATIQKMADEEKRREALTQEERDWEDKVVCYNGFWGTNKGLADMKKFAEQMERDFFFAAIGIKNDKK
jgi:hypothetical protein